MLASVSMPPPAVGRALVLALAFGAGQASADEKIEDPELTGKPAAAPTAAAPGSPATPTAATVPAASGDEKIQDPELTGAAAAPSSSSGFSSRPEYPHDAI